MAQRRATIADSRESLESIAGQLGLTEAGLSILEIRMFGRGPNARVHIQISRDLRLVFDRFADVASGPRLTQHLVTQTGVYMAIKNAQAGEIAAAIFRCAEYFEAATEEDQAREWGTEYLRLASKRPFVFANQADRWQAFNELHRLNPASDDSEDRSARSLAKRSIVLVDKMTGVRFIRCGWFKDYVKREVGSLYSPSALNQLMMAVGWNRPNSQGRIKATNPTTNEDLSWSFYKVPKTWKGRRALRREDEA